jgi:ferredoxin
MLFIDPDSCTHCNACALECPTNAIFADDEVPEQWKDYIQLNAEMAATCPPITERRKPLRE